MDNGLLLVNFGALHQASLDIEKALAELQTQLGQLERDAGPLVATWDGAAQAAYQERQRKWQTAATELSMLNSAWKGMAAGEFEKVKTQYAKDLSDLNRALAETAEAIRTSGVSYDASDSAAASRVTKSGGSGYTLPL